MKFEFICPTFFRAYLWHGISQFDESLIELSRTLFFFKMWFEFLMLFVINVILLQETGPIAWEFSQHWILMACCCSTRASVATVLYTNPCISSCLWVNSHNARIYTDDYMERIFLNFMFHINDTHIHTLVTPGHNLDELYIFIISMGSDEYFGQKKTLYLS